MMIQTINVIKYKFNIVYVQFHYDCEHYLSYKGEEIDDEYSHKLIRIRSKS